MITPEKKQAGQSLKDLRIHLVGIKGTGMCALAEILSARNNRLSGSDVPEVFYTDELLARLSIPVAQGFGAANLPTDCALVIHSAAYDPAVHPELQEALRRDIPRLEYTEALGLLSEEVFSLGVAGVHGKTTTTAMVGSLTEAAGFRGTVLAGSAVKNFGGRSTLIRGQDFFAAETCEYRRNFLRFSPDMILLTSVEEDHLDYFKDLEDIHRAFVEYALSLPSAGRLIYCADDPGACRAAAEASRRRPGLTLIPYGFTAPGPWGIENYRPAAGQSRFTLRALSREFTLRVPGRHNVNNAAGASAAVWELAREKYPERAAGELGEAFCRGLEGFAGSARRCEVLGEAGGVLFLDDYAHHPSAIKTTLKGIREFYPGRRLVVDFMSHTYSRTAALFEDFAASFEAADLLLLHKIYPSARETAQGFSVSGESLFRRIASSREGVFYFEEPLEALDFCLARLREGDLFITLGAGNNGVLGRELYRIRGGKE